MALRAAFELIRNEVEAFRDGSAAAEVPHCGAGAERPQRPPPLAECGQFVDRPAEVDETQAASEVEAAVSEPEMRGRDRHH